MVTVVSRSIGLVYARLAKPCLFRFSPDSVHHTTTRLGRIVGAIAPLRWLTGKLLGYKNLPILAQTIDGIYYQNPVGLSAGFDKNFELLRFLPALGFGFIEGGSLTARPSDGNPGPHYRRLPADKSILVNAGLNNHGVTAIIERIKAYKRIELPLSISVAKTNDQQASSDDSGLDDYLISLKALKQAKVGDSITINISCPNAYGGEPFTTPEKLNRLLTSIDTLAFTQPIYIKMPIDKPWSEFEQLLKVIVSHQVAGVTIGNLAKNRDQAVLQTDIPAGWPGNMSGKPTETLSNQLISQTYKAYGSQLTIIGVGGIFSAKDAYQKIKNGASLVELVTGLIFKGPQLIGEINQQLAKLAQQDGYTSISQAIGSNHRAK